MFSKKDPSVSPEQVNKIAQEYNALVVNVLEKFRQKHYSSSFQIQDVYANFIGIWGIGFEAEDDYSNPFFYHEVWVCIHLDDKGKPDGFICRIHGKHEQPPKHILNRIFKHKPREKYLKCGLSREELEQTLEALYLLPPLTK